MKRLSTIVFLVSVIAASWAPDVLDGRASQGRAHASDSFEARFERHCLKRDTEIKKVSCADAGGHVLVAYLAFNPITGKPRPKEAEYLLRLFALRNDQNTGELALEKLKRDNLNRPDFTAMLQDALIWAEQEKQKSAEELFQTSKAIPDHITQQQWRESYRTAYLFLAMDRGHEKAKQELKEILME